MFYSSVLRAQTEGWATYKNDRWGFQIEYPASWEHDEGIDHAGIAVWLGGDRLKDEQPTIEVGGRSNQPSWGNVENREQVLSEVFSGRPDVVMKIGKSEVLSKKKASFADSPAIFATIAYRAGGRAWIAKTIDFISGDDVVYHLELRCRQAQLSKFDSVFQHVTSSFRPTSAEW